MAFNHNGISLDQRVGHVKAYIENANFRYLSIVRTNADDRVDDLLRVMVLMDTAKCLMMAAVSLTAIADHPDLEKMLGKSV